MRRWPFFARAHAFGFSRLRARGTGNSFCRWKENWTSNCNASGGRVPSASSSRRKSIYGSGEAIACCTKLFSGPRRNRFVTGCATAVSNSMLPASRCSRRGRSKPFAVGKSGRGLRPSTRASLDASVFNTAPTRRSSDYERSSLPGSRRECKTSRQAASVGWAMARLFLLHSGRGEIFHGISRRSFISRRWRRLTGTRLPLRVMISAAPFSSNSISAI